MLNYVGKICLIVLFLFQQFNCGETGNAKIDSPTKKQVQSQTNETPKVSNEEIMQENNAEKDSPVLQVNIAVNDKELQVEYKIKNTTAKPIYIFNVLWDTSTGESRSLPEMVYVSLKDDGELHLSKQIPALPKTKKVEERIIPFATKIEAGKQYGEVIKLPVPVEEMNPYFPRKPDSTDEIKTAENAVFSLQFIRESDELEAEAAPIKEAFSIWHPNLFGNVETLSSKPKYVNVQVERRMDAFERF